MGGSGAPITRNMAAAQRSGHPSLCLSIVALFAELSASTVVLSKLPRCVPDGAFVQKGGAESPWFDQGDMDAERSLLLAQAQ